MRWLGANSTGQTTVEYALLVMLTVIVCITVVATLRFTVLNFYYDVASLVCLPIP